MIFLFIGIFLFIAGLFLRARFKRKHDHSGVEGMNVILIAALILTIFYGIIDRVTIL